MSEFLLTTYTIVLPVLLGYIVWLLKEQRNDRKEESKKRDANSRGTMLMLRYMLERYHTQYMYQGFITRDQYKNCEEIYDAYHALGGNGLATHMWEDIKKLEVRNEQAGLSPFAQEYLKNKEDK